MSSLLQEVTRSGTAASAKVKLQRGDIYGKTGTTNDSMDAWFAGFQRSVVAVVGGSRALPPAITPASWSAWM